MFQRIDIRIGIAHPARKATVLKHRFLEKILDDSSVLPKNIKADSGIAIRKGDIFVMPPNPKLTPDSKYLFFDKR
jgi:hypothetical protein